MQLLTHNGLCVPSYGQLPVTGFAIPLGGRDSSNTSIHIKTQIGVFNREEGGGGGGGGGGVGGWC